MTMFAPCSARARTMPLPMPLLPPVTMATLPSRLMVWLLQWWGSCGGRWVGGTGRVSLGGRDHERGEAHHHGNTGGDAEQRRKGDAGSLQRAGAEGGQAVPQLVERDDRPSSR